MATTQPVVKLTYEDYRATPPEKRYELLDGDLVMVAAPNLKHQKVQFRLGQKLGQFILEHELGEFFYAPCDVVLSETDVVQPDLLFVSRKREHLLSSGENVQGAPDLVVEILSPATADRDRGYKRELYGRHGVTEYWLVDPVAETVSIHRQHQVEGVLALSRTFSRKQTLQSPLLTGLKLDLKDIFSS
ncbi:MAG: Uma2 family endonuclease [Acidobacteria bacterium]|nr:Uma2 family endonuclease [Acidobacteriota bacterium]